MPIKKKHIIIGGLVAATMFTSAFLYWQYTKLMDYCISLKKTKLNKFNLQSADIDLSLNFLNNSNLTIHVISQDYTVLINDKEIIKVTNPKKQSILPESNNELSFNIRFSPEKIGNVIVGIAKDILLAPEKIVITVLVSVKIKLYFLKFTVPYEYKVSLKDLLANKQTNVSEPAKPDSKCKTSPKK